MKKQYGIRQNAIARYFNKTETWVTNQYQAAKMLQSQYGEKIPAEMKTKTAGQIKLAVQKKMRGEAEKILCKGMSVKIKGHTYTITCANNTTENALMEFINKRKL